MAKAKVTISVDDAHLDKMPEVVKKIKKAGLRVDSQLDSIGMITGSIDDEKFDSLNRIKGVSNVQRDEQNFQIAPPDSDVQ
jgi:hypothetical protein